jgi:dGTPase
LNLTFEVREGIIKHSRDYDAREFPQLEEYLLDLRPPLEAQLIDCVDEIAYNTADLDDAREAELLDLNAVRAAVPIFDQAYAQVAATHSEAREKLIFNEALKDVVDLLATDLIETTAARVKDAGSRSVDDVRRAPSRLAGFSEEMGKRNAELKKFLFANIYDRPEITEDRDRSVRCLEELFGYYLESPGSMPVSHEELTRGKSRHEVVCDYIAGMTDQFLLRQWAAKLGGEAA